MKANLIYRTTLVFSEKNHKIHIPFHKNMSDIVCMYIPTSLYHKETVFEKKANILLLNLNEER